MELRTLRYFLAVCEAQSMSRAAERLHVTQPTLSRQIAELERELSCTLLVRHSRSVEPTEAGLHLMDRAGDIVSLADLTAAEYRQGDQVVAGDVRIACGESVGMGLVASAIRSFGARHPRVRFRLHSGNAAYVTNRLERGLDDFGVFISYPLIGHYESLTLPHADSWGIYLPVDDPLAGREGLTPQDVSRLPLITSEQAVETDELSSWFGDLLGDLRIVATYTLSYNAQLLVRAGVGYMLGIAGMVPTGTGSSLAFVPLLPAVSARIDFCWRRDHALSNAARLFLDDMRACCGRDATS